MSKLVELMDIHLGLEPESNNFPECEPWKMKRKKVKPPVYNTVAETVGTFWEDNGTNAPEVERELAFQKAIDEAEKQIRERLLDKGYYHLIKAEREAEKIKPPIELEKINWHKARLKKNQNIMEVYYLGI